MNVLGLVGVTCPVACPVASSLFFSFQEIFTSQYVLRACPVATHG